MAMTDDERIIEALANSRYESNYGDAWEYQPNEVRAAYRQYAAKQLAALRRVGGDVTLPPAPEPTYTRTFTETEWGFLIAAADHYRGTNPVTGGPTMPDGRLLVSHMEEQNPDPEPGA